MTTINPNLSPQEQAAYEAFAAQYLPGRYPTAESRAALNALIQDYTQSGRIGEFQTPGARGPMLNTQALVADAFRAQNPGGAPVLTPGSSNTGGWGMFLQQFLPAALGIFAGSGALGQLLGGAGGAAGAGAGAAGGAGAGTGLLEGLSAAELANLVTVTAPSTLSTLGGIGGAVGGGALGSALSGGPTPVEGVTVTGQAPPPGGDVVGGLVGGGAWPTVEEVVVTGNRPPPSEFEPIDLGFGIGADAPKPPTQAKPQEKGPLSRTLDVLGQVLGNMPQGRSAGGVPAGAPSAPSAPVMASASPFGGGGSGAGTPAGLAIKGSTAPDIYPWTRV